MSNRNRIINQRTAYLQMQQMHQTATYADYDAAGRLPGFTNFNGTQTAYSYDNANRLTAINNQKSDAGVIAGYAFALDANGNRTHIAQEEPYAPALGEGGVDYTYNTQKNRLLSTSAEGSFGYDDEGQLQTGYSTDYTFDYEHRLKTIGGTQFYYDGGGKRLKALRDGVATRYIYDAGGTLLAEADENNNITKYYIYGGGLLAMVTPGDQTYCYHYNGIGSTTAMTNASQEIINKYSYDVFGNVASEQEIISQPFKYVGQFGVMTEPNGFYYMKARYYDPTVGRFISEDPIGFEGGDVNLLAYVGNNPVTGIDPSGLCGESSGIANNIKGYIGNAASSLENFLSNGKVSSVALTVGGIAAIGLGIAAIPVEAPVVAGGLIFGGIVAVHEGALTGVINYGLGGDTSSVPLPLRSVYNIGKGMIENKSGNTNTILPFNVFAH